MFPQIYLMAMITLVLSTVLWSGLIYAFSGHQKRYFWLLLLGLPLSTVANLIFKPLAMSAAGQAAGLQLNLGLALPAWFLAFSVLVTPLIEEPIKILPLLLRPAWKMVTSRASALWVGFALGVSFGLGEAIFLAFVGARDPASVALPWYAFTGYLIERLFTCFAHGVLTAVLVSGMQRGGRYLLFAFLAAFGLHLFLNAPATMYSFQWISLALLNLSLPVPYIVLAVIFVWMRHAAREPKEVMRATEIVYRQRPGKIG